MTVHPAGSAHPRRCPDRNTRQPRRQIIAPTGKAFDENFGTIAKWDGELLIEEFVLWDSALQAQQIGPAADEILGTHGRLLIRTACGSSARTAFLVQPCRAGRRGRRRVWASCPPAARPWPC